MKPVRPWKEVLDEWAPELAARLGRPEAEIRSRGLSAGDFSIAQSVEIRYPYGLSHRVTFAFAVVRPEKRQAAVFSEHAGYIEFDLIEGCEVVEWQESFYRQKAQEPD